MAWAFFWANGVQHLYFNAFALNRGFVEGHCLLNCLKSMFLFFSIDIHKYWYNVACIRAYVYKYIYKYIILTKREEEWGKKRKERGKRLEGMLNNVIKFGKCMLVQNVKKKIFLGHIFPVT